MHFLIGGTQTNLTVICAALRPHQAVFGTTISHINTHEAGAIEHVCHRVLPLPHKDGKLTAEQIRAEWHKYATDPSREHWVQPKMVYISQPTEIGSMYSKKSCRIYTRLPRIRLISLYRWCPLRLCSRCSPITILLLLN